ncbi:MAG: hypothetical protein GC168_00695 [Candidatus Hydrogenedens sp.]|nr:hypothetical protein [Candidatus Hydrogenedens sp.]
MPQRVHVLALRNTPRAQLVRVFPKAAQLDLYEEHGWLWFAMPVWTTTQEELLGVAEQCGAPALAASVLEGGRWLLRLRYPDGGLFSMLHEFLLIELLRYEGGQEEDLDADAYPGWADGVPLPLPALGVEVPPSAPYEGGMAMPEGGFFAAPLASGEGQPHFADAMQQELTAFGCPMPDDVLQELRELDTDDATADFLSWQGDELCDALEAFDIGHEPEAVLDIVTGESVSDGELDTELGNLPRLLMALGIEAGFDAWLEDSAYDYDEEDDEMEIEEQLEDIAYLVSLTSRQSPVALAGAPVSIPFDQIALVARVAWFADPSVGGALKYVLPGDADLDEHDPPETFLPGAYGGERPLFPGELFHSSRERGELARDLAELPEGTELELLTGSEAYECGRMIFRGELAGGAWRLRYVAPAFSKAQLESALTLARSFQSDGPLACESEAEAEAVLVRAEAYAQLESTPPRREGSAIACSPELRPWIALTVFRRRFRGLIDTESVEIDERVAFEQAMEMEREMSEKTAVPVAGPPVFETPTAAYYRVDSEQLEFAGDARGARHLLKRRDAEMAEAGFQYAGDIAGSRFPDVLQRCFLADDGIVLAVQFLNLYGLMHRELYTRLDNGGSLTTTGGSRGESIPHRKILERLCPEDDLGLLRRDHAAGLGQLQDLGIQPVPIAADLGAIAEAIEDYYLRRLG